MGNVPILKTTPEQQQKLKDIEIRAAKLETNAKELNWLSKILLISSIFGSLLTISGGAIAGLGFRWWYWRLQLYQDQATQGDATKS